MGIDVLKKTTSPICRMHR